jgi:hypothetical protein
VVGFFWWVVGGGWCFFYVCLTWSNEGIETYGARGHR